MAAAFSRLELSGVVGSAERATSGRRSSGSESEPTFPAGCETVSVAGFGCLDELTTACAGM
ncbi:hypothetical protein K8R78_05305 [bacterium]|nr:hypothetical protein [bacterium]